MKTDPLLIALHSGPRRPKHKPPTQTAAQAPATTHPLTEARVLHLHSSELPNVLKVKIGDKVNLKVFGQVQTMHDDGRAVMHIHGVKPDADVPEQTHAPDKPPIVRLETSHG